ncbi:MAG: cytochrome b/b6 domain-containing protein [Magnetococcales bacterium]|nr:cytochrome b/b6 domain-containing protein [Magnetococcales bacterium]
MNRPMVELYPVWLRVWHWFNATNFLLLLLSGAVLHFPESALGVMPFPIARMLHNVCGVMMALGYGFYLFGSYVSRNWQHYVPEHRGFLARMLTQVRFYAVGIFQGGQQPFPATVRAKFNPLQQVTYLGVMFGLVPVLVVTGIMFLFPEYAPDRILDRGGIWPLALLHQAVAALLVAFLVGHIYLATAGETLLGEFHKMVFGEKVCEGGGSEGVEAEPHKPRSNQEADAMTGKTTQSGETMGSQRGIGHVAFLVVLLVGVLLIGTGKKWLYPFFFEKYTGVVNRPLTYATSKPVSDAEFEAMAQELTEKYRAQKAERVVEKESNPFARRIKTNMLMQTRSFMHETPFPHIRYFRDAGIRQYEGPNTCLRCHATMKVTDHEGKVTDVDTLNDVVESVHYKFQRSSPGFSTYGYDGRQVNAPGSRPIPVGKIDRACGVPGSFSWTGWAELAASRPNQPEPGKQGVTPPSPADARGDALQPASVAQGAVVMPPHGAAMDDAVKHAMTAKTDATAVPEHKEGIVTRSEGCGQCHIGGGYHPATEKMMPVGDVPEVVKQGIDCLICHAQAYDMNFRHVIKDEGGNRWNQDRTLKAALTVGLPTKDNCMFCHQHNMGGDLEANLKGNAAPRNLGYDNPRLLHPGAKRANSITADNDIHAEAGLICTDCHVPQGHKIPRGTKGVDLVATDLPEQEVTCEGCHTNAAHLKSPYRAILNGHLDRVSCEACHIHSLGADSVMLRDWIHPVWNEEEGVYIYRDVLRSGDPGKGFLFLWFNGNGTFLANALGDNPLGGDGYNPLMNQMARIDDPQLVEQVRQAALEIKKKYPTLDVERYVREATQPLTALSPEMLAKRQRMVQENIRPIMKQGHSRIYPFKVFNAIMYEDMSNQGPFGAMILPFDYPSYYEKGDPLASMTVAIQNPIVRRMYQLPFKGYMMDAFMNYFGVDKWSGIYPIGDDGQLRNVESHWMRQMGTLMVNHGIQREGRGCRECHDPNGIINFKALGYPEDRIRDLTHLPELEKISYAPTPKIKATTGMPTHHPAVVVPVPGNTFPPPPPAAGRPPMQQQMPPMGYYPQRGY